MSLQQQWRVTGWECWHQWHVHHHWWRLQASGQSAQTGHLQRRAVSRGLGPPHGWTRHGHPEGLSQPTGRGWCNTSDTWRLYLWFVLLVPVVRVRLALGPFFNFLYFLVFPNFCCTTFSSNTPQFPNSFAVLHPSPFLCSLSIFIISSSPLLSEHLLSLPAVHLPLSPHDWRYVIN